MASASTPMRLFVGNFPWATTEDELTELFGEFGEINHVQICMDRETGRSRGFGFVEFANRDKALKSIEALDGEDFGGRALHVSEAVAKSHSRK